MGLLGYHTTKTPIEPNLKLQATKDTKIEDKEKYQRLVRRLIYLSHTRPNIAFVVSIVSLLHACPKTNPLRSCLQNSKIFERDSKKRNIV